MRQWGRRFYLLEFCIEVREKLMDMVQPKASPSGMEELIFYLFSQRSGTSKKTNAIVSFVEYLILINNK